MKTDFVEVLENAEDWEERKLGASMEHAEVASDNISAEVDDQLELQAISIRLPKSLIRDLKEIAGRYEIGYQPMVRDLLNRFSRAEQKKYLLDKLKQINEINSDTDDTAPVTEFIADIRKEA